jgi:FG-GAP-like repeat
MLLGTAACCAVMALAGGDLHGVAPLGVAGSDSAALAGVGDVNGDGVADVAVGLQDDRRTPDPAGLDEIAVVGFTGADPARPGFGGLVLSHLPEPVLQDDRGSFSFGQAAGGDVVGVGDWDGDGLADVAIGAAGAGPHGRPNAGSVYVVLGRRESAALDVRSAPGIVRIDGPARESMAGSRIAPAGDFDGDGRPDVVIALPGERAIVVRGGVPAGTTIDLAHPPAGMTIELRGLDGGTSRTPRDERSLRLPEAAAFAPVGDVDGDGRGELLVGIPAVEPLRGRGKALVVRGAPGGSVVDAARDGAVLARARGEAGFGGAVAALPDADGDGHPEWIVGAATPENVFGGGELPNGAFVILSRARGEVRPGRPGQPVVTIDARGRGDGAGRAVAGIPDATGDGVPDLLVGLPDANASCRDRAGAIALVPGRRTPGTVRVGARVARLDGPHPGARIGSSIALAGGDLLEGAPPFDNAASLELWRVPLSALAGSSPPLPAARRCLSVRIAKRTRAQLRRDGRLRVSLRSDAGDGRAHRVRLRVVVDSGQTEREGAPRTVSFPRAGGKRLTLRFPHAGARLLDGRRTVYVYVTAQQTFGAGVRTSRGAFGADGLTLR